MASREPDTWVQEFRRAVDSDTEIHTHGRYFTCSYLLDMEEHTVAVSLHRGKVDEVVIDPGPLSVPYQFAVRASADTWRKFSEPTPPPMYHGIWAASFQRDMRLEGDLLVMMQNLRCFTRNLELLRQVGVPV
jgi:hypothetical protein